MPARRSVLLVTQYSPPSQLSGARRPANLTKYLARRGHRVTVLTSLASGSGDLPGAQRLLRTRDVLSSRLNWRRGNWESMEGSTQASASQASVLERVILPDLGLVGWIPFALPRALSLAGRARFDCVVTTSPPQSAHLIGWMLRRRGIPWVADLRDGWTFDPPRRPWPTRAQEIADRALERAVLSRADRLVAVTEPIARDLRDRLGRDVAVITNGFDPEEYEGEPHLDADLLSPQRHSLVHTGRAGISGRSPAPLIDGLAELRRRSPDAPDRLEVAFAGPTTDEERALLADERAAGMARSVGTLPREQTLALQRQADSLLVIAAGASGPSVATNKLFEYFAAGKPVLVVGDGSEAARIVRATGAGLVAPAGDPGAVADALERLMGGDRPVATEIERFAWPALAELFEREIEAACS